MRRMAKPLAAILEGRYSRRVVGQPACPADLLFVLAGLPERKRYGWELFQRGLASTLLLSVARSEARFIRARAGLPEDGNIIGLLPIRPESGNHIFLWADAERVHAEVVRLPELNTFGEVWALSELIQRCGFRHVLILSTDVHLRRIRYAVRILLDATPVRITYLGVPAAQHRPHQPRWWSRRRDAWLVITEWGKLAGYHVKYGVFHRHWRYESHACQPSR